MNDENKKEIPQDNKEYTHYFPVIELISKLRSEIIYLISWTVTISIAILGFFLSMLLQIKFQGIVPYKILIIFAILSILISIIVGIWIRFSLGHDKLEMISSMTSLESGIARKKDTGKKPSSIQSRYKRFLEESSNYVDFLKVERKIYYHLGFFSIGTILVIVYFVIYLFSC